MLLANISTKWRLPLLIYGLGALSVGLLMVLIGLSSTTLANSPPGSVSNITATRSTGTLTASWTAGSGATSYHITYSSDNRASWSLASADHSSTSITISGVDDNKTYIVGVRAKNSSGGSSWVNSAPIAPNGQTVPGSVSNITATRTASSITVNWTAGSNATGYHVVYSNDGRASWTALSDNHSSTTMTIGNVEASKTYIVGIRSKNGNNYSSWVNSSPIAPLSQNAPPSTPTKIYMQMSGRGNGTLPIYWRHDKAGQTVTYDVNYSDNNRASWSRAATEVSGGGCTHNETNDHLNNSDNHCYTITGLDNKKTYIVSVRAKANNLYSGWYNSRVFKTIPSPTMMYVEQRACQGSSNYVLFAYGHNRSSNVTTGYSYEVGYKIGSGSWVTHDNSTVPLYDMFYGDTSAFWGHIHDVLPATETSYTVQVGGRYTKTVGGEKIVGDWDIESRQMGTSSDTDSKITRCVGDVENVVASASRANTSIGVTWEKPTTGFKGKLSYEVRYRVNSGSWVVDNTNLVDLTNTQATIRSSSWSTGDTIDVEVRARDWNSLVGASNWVSANTTTW